MQAKRFIAWMLENMKFQHVIIQNQRHIAGFLELFGFIPAKLSIFLFQAET